MEQTSKCFYNSIYISPINLEISAFFSGITYVAPKVPTLYTVLSSGNLSTNPAIYGYNTNSHVLGHNDVIEIVLNNLDPGKHPFHLRNSPSIPTYSA